MEIVTADIGGTNARFAIAAVESGQVVRLDPPVVLCAADHAGLASAWRAFAAALGRPLPRHAAIAVAAPTAAVFRFTNSSWVVDPQALGTDPGLDGWLVLNDFAAVAHGVAALDAGGFRHFAGPVQPVEAARLTSIIGPGTGLGIAQLLRAEAGHHVIATEGGHVGFSPCSALEERIAARIAARFGRCSTERLVSGAGLAAIAETLCESAGRSLPTDDHKALWSAALAGRDPLLDAALGHFCAIWGAVAGDLALAQGAEAVVLAGGIGQRLADRLAASDFHKRFIAKGRYADRLAALPIWQLTHPEPGLFGAAAAFAARGG